MRVSLYNIYVELENNEEYFFVVNGYTGAMDLLKKHIVSELMNSKDSFSSKTTKTEVIKLLIKRGYLTSLSKSEEHHRFKKISQLVHDKTGKKNSFLFAVTQNCNFRCPYCFENKSCYTSGKFSKKTFTKELVNRAYEAIFEIQPDRKKIDNIIGLYGGEPLLKENYNIVEYIISEGQKLGFTFKATTNGYDLDHYAELLGKGKIERINVSLDGLQETNNKKRLHFKNHDTFSKILKNIELSLSRGVQVRNRINIDRCNFKEVVPLMRLFKDKGFIENKDYSAYLANIRYDETSDIFNKKGLSTIDYISIVSCLKKRVNGFAFQDRNIKNLVKNAVEQNILNTPKVSFCGASRGMFIFDPKGHIYTCWEKLGVKGHIVGTFNDKVVFNNQVLDSWHSRIVGNIEECSLCAYALWCGGGCPAILKPVESIDLNRAVCMDYPKMFAKMVNEYYNETLNE